MWAFVAEFENGGNQEISGGFMRAKPTAFCEVCTASGKGVVNSAFLKFRRCIDRKARKYGIFIGVGGGESEFSE